MPTPSGMRFPEKRPEDVTEVVRDRDTAFQKRAVTTPVWTNYSQGMKVKVSITLSSDLVRAIDRAAQPGQSRSQFVENALRAFFPQMQCRQRDARDLEILNKHANRLNAEAEDVLGYQVIP